MRKGGVIVKDRIKVLRELNGLTQTEFGEKIGVKQGTIAGYESGNRTPINAVIDAICREFNVNKEWLLTGKGKMFCAKEKSEDISIFLEKVLQDEDVSLRKRLIFSLAQLDESDWEILEKIAFKITNAHFKEKPNNRTEETAEETLPTVEEAEREYIKKISCSARKKILSATNTTKDDEIKKISDGLV